jgi:hypothetical protein
MSGKSNDRELRPADRHNIYSDLRERNARRMETARILEARRVRQIERVIQAARNSKPPGQT